MGVMRQLAPDCMTGKQASTQLFCAGIRDLLMVEDASDYNFRDSGASMRGCVLVPVAQRSKFASVAIKVNVNRFQCNRHEYPSAQGWPAYSRQDPGGLNIVVFPTVDAARHEIPDFEKTVSQPLMAMDATSSLHVL